MDDGHLRPSPAIAGEWRGVVASFPQVENPALLPVERDVFPPVAQGPREARFSLEGLLIPRDVSVPAHLGLHHHGDEPEVWLYRVSFR